MLYNECRWKGVIRLKQNKNQQESQKWPAEAERSGKLTDHTWQYLPQQYIQKAH